MPSDGVDFIDKDNAGCVLLALLEQVAYSRSAHTNKHLDEIRTRNRKERNVRFAGNRTRQQSLAGSRRAHHQNALRNSAAQLLKIFRLFPELNNLLYVVLGLFNTSAALKRHAILL